jgi:multiple sugar transport system permease protein
MEQFSAETQAVVAGPVQVRLGQFLGRDWALGYLFLAPVLAVLLGLMAYPFILAVYLSLTNKTIGSQADFIGLANYVDLLSNTEFRQTALTTFIYTAGTVGVKFVIGMATALLVNRQLKGRDLSRALLFIPWSIPVVVAAYSWRWIFDDMNGVLNLILTRLHLTHDFIYWLADPRVALYSVMAVVIWVGTPFYTMNFLAGMQAIPLELYEAADLDGAGPVAKFLYVTLPSLEDVIVVTLLLSTIWTANQLQYVFVLTQGGPIGTTQTFPYLAYQISMGAKELGRGAAVPLMFFPLFLVLIYVLSRRMLSME